MTAAGEAEYTQTHTLLHTHTHIFGVRQKTITVNYLTGNNKHTGNERVKIKLRRVRVTIIAEEKLIIIIYSECMCSCIGYLA